MMLCAFVILSLQLVAAFVAAFVDSYRTADVAVDAFLVVVIVRPRMMLMVLNDNLTLLVSSMHCCRRCIPPCRRELISWLTPVVDFAMCIITKLMATIIVCICLHHFYSIYDAVALSF